VQRRLGGTILINRIDRFREQTGRKPDDWSFSERDLVKHFRGESRALQWYVLDAVRTSITHHQDNKLRDFVEYSGKGGDRPLSYSTIEKTFYSFFIHQGMLDTAMDWRMQEGENPREIEKDQIVHLMNLICELLYVGKFDLEIGTDKLENRLQKGEDIPDVHLRAFRMAKEEVIYTWLRYVRDIIRTFFSMQGKVVSEVKLFQYRFPESLWTNISNFIRNLGKLPLWVNHEMTSTVFGGKLPASYWQTIFETGSSPQGQKVLAVPLNYLDLIKP
jgi:hypothetical protein